MSMISWFHTGFGSMFGNSSPAATAINPASGLPMTGGVDIQGNPFGTTHHSQHMSSSFDHIDNQRVSTTTGIAAVDRADRRAIFWAKSVVILPSAATIWDLRSNGCNLLGVKTDVWGTELPRVVLAGLRSRKAHLDLCAS